MEVQVEEEAVVHCRRMTHVANLHGKLPSIPFHESRSVRSKRLRLAGFRDASGEEESRRKGATVELALNPSVHFAARLYFD